MKLGRKILLKRILGILICLFFYVDAHSQHLDNYPHAFPQYSFINYKVNRMQFGPHKENFTRVLATFDTLLTKGEGHLNFVHIGASHIQADQFSGRIRENFYNLLPGLVNDRGFVFPYKMAATNHPFNYYSTYTGEWETFRNVEYKKESIMGLSGITARTTDTLSEFSIIFKKNDYPAFASSRIKVLHSMGDTCFDIELVVPDSLLCSRTTYDYYTEFETATPLDTLTFRVVRYDTIQRMFELYGIIAGSSYPSGITYNAIGINGATVFAFLRCSLFKEHLTILKPDVVLLSLGINDVQNRNFSPDEFESKCSDLINLIREVNPQTCIILTTNSDSYYRRRYPNEMSLKAQDVFFKLLHKYPDVAVWNWFNVMGGLGKVKKWKEYNLAKPDLIHFTKEGYFLLADLFFSAFMKEYEYYIKQNEAHAGHTD